MASDRPPEQAALRRIILVAVAVMGVVVGFGFILRSVIGRPSGVKAGVPAPGSLGGLLPGILGPAEEQAREPPPDLRETAEKLADITRENWGKAGFIQPRDEEIDRATGEVTLPFEGFGISIDTEPEGAQVAIDGREIGDSPVIASVDCTPGAEIRVRIKKAPLKPQERTTRCRADKLVRLKVRLGR